MCGRTCGAEEQEGGHAAAEQVEALHGGCQELPAARCLYLYGGGAGQGRRGRQGRQLPAQMLLLLLPPLFRSRRPWAWGQGWDTGAGLGMALSGVRGHGDLQAWGSWACGVTVAIPGIGEMGALLHLFR